MRQLRLARDLLALDVGNTKVEAVLYVGGRERGRWRLDDRGQRRGWLLDTWKALLGALGGEPAVPLVLSGVDPRRARLLLQAARRGGLRPVHAVRWDDPWPFRIAVDEPRTLGTDRLANVAGLRALGLARAVAVDVGTAVTIDVLCDGRFEGGLILPGHEMSLRALRDHTAELPAVPVRLPPSFLGRDTPGAMRAGVVHVTRLGIASAAEALRRGLGRGAEIVITGGSAEGLLELLPRRARAQPDLQFLGLRALAARLGLAVSLGGAG